MVEDPGLDLAVRTLAWLGDAEFEVEIRRRVAFRGDIPVQRKNQVAAALAHAAAQAQLLASIEPLLDEAETAVVRRGRNAPTRRTPPRGIDRRIYRASTGLETLVAVWALDPKNGTVRIQNVLHPAIDRAIDALVGENDAT